MNLASLCIKNNRTAAILFLFLFLAGLQTFFSISRREDPDFTIRVAAVYTYFEGASPQKVEELITDKIEKKAQEMAEVKAVTSQSLSGMSLVFVEIHDKYMDLQPIWTRLRNRMNDIKGELPQGSDGPYVDDEYGDVYPVVLAVTGDGYTYRELKDYADDIRNRLLTVPSVAKVNYHGVQEERIYVEFSNARLAETGFSPMQVAQELNSQNVLQPGGSAVVGPERITIEPTGEFESLEQLRRVSLRIPGKNEAVYLGDLCEIRRGFVDPPQTLVRYNGKPALMLSVSMAKGARVTDMGEQITAKLKEIHATLPVGLEPEIFIYVPEMVEEAIGNFMSNLGQAFLFVVIVMLLFCGLRMGVIAGLLVPMAMMMCLAVMPFLHIELHSISIAALIISLGILVDNGVVTSENILVRLAAGENRMEACKGAVNELWMPLLAASATTIFAFLPIGLAEGGTGEYCLSLFQVVAITLLSSWLLSISLIPMLCYYFLQPKKTKQSFDSRMYRTYRRLLEWSLQHRLAFLGLIGLLIFSSSLVWPLVPQIYFPPKEGRFLMVDFWQPYGTDIHATRDRVRTLESFLQEREDQVDKIGIFVGDGGPRWSLAINVESQNPNFANVIIHTKSFEATERLFDDIGAFLEQRFPDCRYTVRQLVNGPPVAAPIQIRLTGDNMDTIYALRDRMAEELAQVPGVINIRDDWGEWVKKFIVDVNQEAAKKAGFSSFDVAQSLQAQISGLISTEYREGKNVIPIVLRSDEAYREDLGRIETLNVYSYAAGKSIPLMTVADTALSWEPSNIRHRDNRRQMTISTDVEGRFASQVLADIQPRMTALMQSDDWVDGYTIQYAGEDLESKESQAQINRKLPLAMGLLTLVLIAQFNSIRRPLIIGLTIPPMFIGIAYGLLVSQAPFGFMAFLGAISLMGIIVNNAIMMIDRIEIEKGLGQDPANAVFVAAQRRLRPILMTTITTIVGLIPLSLQGGEMWRPMANTIIFGLAFATVLTLLLCPVLYSLLFRVSYRDFTWDAKVLEKSSE